MRRDIPSTYQCLSLTSSTTLTTRDVSLSGLFVAGVSGITITLPAPQAAINGAECMIVNDSDGNVTISCSNGFPNNADSITLSAGGSVLLYCAAAAGSSYRWATVGATAT